MTQTQTHRISGLSLVRNGSRFDYPYLESLRSMLPLVDELVINVGYGDDDTLRQVQNFAHQEGKGKVVIFESDWQLDHPEKLKGGQILSEQTNLALERCRHDWCLYLQADEVLHETDFPQIRMSLEENGHREDVEGLLFDYVHFYGSYDVVQYSRSTYRREVRMIRKSSTAHSIGDAQSFRKKNGEKLRVVHAGGKVYHYGWVRTPSAMKEKTFFFDQLYHGLPDTQSAQTQTPYTGENYKYKRIWGLSPFKGTHPSVMKERIQKKGWHWNLNESPLTLTWSDAKKITLDTLEKITGYRFFEYRSYKLIR